MVRSPDRWITPPTDNPTISLSSFEQIGRLQLKRLEYQRRRPLPDTQPDFNVARTDDNFSLLLHYCKDTVTGIVIALAVAPNRDTLTQPITMYEVATNFQEITGVDVAGALAIPFIYDQENDWDRPDTEYTMQHVSPAAGLFAEAYGIVRAYAWNRPELVQLEGGTGLPEMPTY